MYDVARLLQRIVRKAIHIDIRISEVLSRLGFYLGFRLYIYTQSLLC